MTVKAYFYKGKDDILDFSFHSFCTPVMAQLILSSLNLIQKKGNAKISYF